MRRSACTGMGDACGMKVHATFMQGIMVAVLAMLVAAMPSPAAEAASVGKNFPVHPRGGQAQTAPASVQTATGAAAAGAQPIVSTPLTSTQAFESQPLSFPDSGRRRTRAAGDREYSMPSIWPALLAVVVVCGVFCTILYCMKKYLPGHRQMFSHPAMEVLGRTHLDQRRYVSLIRVGKRIVVVGVSPDEMRSLSEITDEEEITEIMEVARPKSDAGLTIFQRLFQRHVVEAEAEETRVTARARADEIEEQMSSLRERVREIREIEQPRATRQLDTVG